MITYKILMVVSGMMILMASLANASVFFTYPTPANNTNDLIYPIVFNMTSTDAMGDNNFIEIDGGNNSCTLATNNLSCIYTISYGLNTIFNHTYSAIGYANISGAYNTTNETRVINYYGCGYVYTSGTLIGNVSISDGNPCFEVQVFNISFDGRGYTINGSGGGAGIDSKGYGYNNYSNFKITGFDNGIYMEETGGKIALNTRYNKLVNITAYNNSDGIHLYFNNIASYASIINCTVYDNVDYGIYLWDDNDIVTGNNVYNNGVQMFSDTGNGGGTNLIYNNIFNATGAQVVAQDNWGDIWNTTKNCSQTNIIGGNCIGGNWYSDYNGTDMDNSGIGNIDYNLSGGGNAVDYLPLTNTLDIVAPSVFFDTPTDNSSTYRNAKFAQVNVSASDDNLKNLTIMLYNSIGNLINSSTTTSTNLFANFSINSYGIYYMNATAFDDAGNSNKTETRNITINAVAPATQTTNIAIDILIPLLILSLVIIGVLTSVGVSHEIILLILEFFGIIAILIIVGTVILGLV
jgi:hypothetical protein